VCVCEGERYEWAVYLFYTYMENRDAKEWARKRAHVEKYIFIYKYIVGACVGPEGNPSSHPVWRRWRQPQRRHNIKNAGKRYFAPIHLRIARDCFNKIHRPAAAPRWPTSPFVYQIT